ncbi:MAG TPA: GNAT family N-acetyltransferase [Kofleriaceae bacterium]|jgi:ribosomal protein S18 acetylase RimI-like enzyme
MDYELVATAPPIGDYIALRANSGLTPITEPQARGAIANSWAWCHVRDESGRAVAMGRVLGDGGWYFHVADMATEPAHQRRGLGRRVLDHLIARIHEVAPPGAFISLLADPPGLALYRAAGFVATPELGMELPRRNLR